MNNKKISFISCVNDFEEYNTALRHIHNLKVPHGYEIETIAIEKAASITSGYNEAMKKVMRSIKFIFIRMLIS